MESRNNTRTLEFILLGLSEEPELQPFIFGLLLSMYLVTLTGNLLIIMAIISDSHLHSPMYFFLFSLSLCDICFTTTTVPKMLVNMQTENKAITYGSCIIQMFFFLQFAGLEEFLLAVMAYDHFLAIYHPLHYTVTMNPWLCLLLVLGAWIMSVLHSLIHSLMVLRLSFLNYLEIPHFFCELNQMIQLACSDTFLNYIALYIAAGVFAMDSFAGILFSYSKMVSSIHAISSTWGKYKALCTYGSHLSVVSLFYCTTLIVHLSPVPSHNTHSGAAASVMYTVFSPMLNPFIHSLRNKDIKGALGRFLWKEAMKLSFVLEKKQCTWLQDTMA